MEWTVTKGEGVMTCWCVRLHRGDDLMERIRQLAREAHIRAGVALSAVGCVSRARVRDAGGVNLRDVAEDCEIVSLTGTVSEERCHLHIALAREDLSTVGGHLVEGCIVNTTCELVIGALPGLVFGGEPDGETDYDELTVTREKAGG